MNIDVLHALVNADIDTILGNNPCLPEWKRHSLESQRINISKKFVTALPALEDAAFQTFSEFNIRGRSFVIEPSTGWLQQVLESVTYRIERLFRPLERMDDELLFLCDLGSFGTGASTGTDDNILFKVSCDTLTFSSSSTLVAYKRWCKSRSSGWTSSEKERQYNHGSTRCNFGKCTFVPKDTSKYRMVVTEPSLDMLFQRGLGSFIDGMLIRDFSVDITSQEGKNREMARRGSIDQSLGTIDSTSASDSIYAVPLLNAGVLSQYSYELIRSIKSDMITYKDKRIKISMLGTQGCGFTFSFMTYLLCSIVEAVYDLQGIPFQNGVNVGVYGDDVIVSSRAYDAVITAMEMFGFVPNKSKSFNNGPFRESCGGDFYKGQNVRNFYCKRLTTKQHHCIAFNRLLEYCSHIGFLMYDSLLFLADQVGLDRKVPLFENEDAGLYYPFIQGRYAAWFPRRNLRRLPDIHYDARVQFSIYGVIQGTGVLCRSDANNTRYYTQRKYCVVLATRSSWTYAISGCAREKYIQDLYRFWMYVSAVR